MKREVLFEAVRDEQGDLSLQITETGIGIDMSDIFWKGIIKRLEKPTETDQYFDKEEMIRKGEVIKILKEGVAAQEEEEREKEIP